VTVDCAHFREEEKKERRRRRERTLTTTTTWSKRLDRLVAAAANIKQE